MWHVHQEQSTSHANAGWKVNYSASTSVFLMQGISLRKCSITGDFTMVMNSTFHVNKVSALIINNWRAELCLHCCFTVLFFLHYSDVIMSTIESQITGVQIVCSIVCSGADQRRHQHSASLAFVRGIHRWPVDSAHKGPVTRKILPFDDVIMSVCDKGLPTLCFDVCRHRFFTQPTVSTITFSSTQPTS